MLQSTPFHSTLTAIIRQNATSTPGDSARLTRVELSEKAITNPATASTPNVIALAAVTARGARVVDAGPTYDPIRTRWRCSADAYGVAGAGIAGPSTPVWRPSS